MFKYYKLFDLLNRRGMKKMDLLNAGISAPTLAKLSKGEVVKTDMLDKICTFLECQPGDIMEHILDESNGEIITSSGEVKKGKYRAIKSKHIDKETDETIQEIAIVELNEDGTIKEILGYASPEETEEE